MNGVLQRRFEAHVRWLRKNAKPSLHTSWIYLIVDVDNTVKYVGAARNPAGRYRMHCTSRLGAKSPIGRWIRSELAQGRLPRMRLAARTENLLGQRFLWDERVINALEKSIIRDAANGVRMGNIDWHVDLLNCQHNPLYDFAEHKHKTA